MATKRAVNLQPDQVKDEDKEMRPLKKRKRTVYFEVKEVVMSRDAVTVTNQTTVETQPSGVVPRLDLQPVSPPPAPLFASDNQGGKFAAKELNSLLAKCSTKDKYKEQIAELKKQLELVGQQNDALNRTCVTQQEDLEKATLENVNFKNNFKCQLRVSFLSAMRQMEAAQAQLNNCIEDMADVMHLRQICQMFNLPGNKCLEIDEEFKKDLLIGVPLQRRVHFLIVRRQLGQQSWLD